MRRSVSILFVFLVVLGLGLPLTGQPKPPPPPFPSSPFTPPLTPENLWKQLKYGNDKYQGGSLPYTDIDEARDRTKDKQKPPVTVLSCSDSRVPAELVFGRTVGDLFVVRVAGNAASAFDIASIEYAIDHEWTKLIVVMGHEKCGAVEAALDPVDPGTPSLVALVQRIRESFIGWQTWTGPESERVERAVKANARSSAAYLLAHSTVIRKAVLDGKVGLIVAYYKLKSGEVEVLPDR